MAYQGQEKRKHPRIGGRFIVSYRMLKKEEDENRRDLTQTKNLSLGGMLLTTNKEFKPETRLAIEIRLPFDPSPMMLVAKVIESRKIIENLIYDTRLEFLAIDEHHKHIVDQTVQYYIKK